MTRPRALAFLAAAAFVYAVVAYPLVVLIALISLGAVAAALWMWAELLLSSDKSEER